MRSRLLVFGDRWCRGGDSARRIGWRGQENRIGRDTTQRPSIGPKVNTCPLKYDILERSLFLWNAT